jgi:hypothetical protein
VQRGDITARRSWVRVTNLGPCRPHVRTAATDLMIFAGVHAEPADAAAAPLDAPNR